MTARETRLRPFAPPGEVAHGRYDMVFLAIPSTGLRGPWLDEFLGRRAGGLVILIRLWVETVVRGVGAAEASRLYDALEGESLGGTDKAAYWLAFHRRG